jgi:hypothetical protein
MTTQMASGIAIWDCNLGSPLGCHLMIFIWFAIERLSIGVLIWYWYLGCHMVCYHDNLVMLSCYCEDIIVPALLCYYLIVKTLSFYQYIYCIDMTTLS